MLKNESRGFGCIPEKTPIGILVAESTDRKVLDRLTQQSKVVVNLAYVATGEKGSILKAKFECQGDPGNRTTIK